MKLASLGKTQNLVLLGKRALRQVRAFVDAYDILRQKNIRTKEGIKEFNIHSNRFDYIPILKCLHLWCWSATSFVGKNRRGDDFTLAAMPSFLAVTRNLMVMVCRMYALFRQPL